MPLMHGKSGKAFSHNVAAEMDAGKPQKQSLAIAYNIKRKAKKMAKGGMMCAEGGGVHESAYGADKDDPKFMQGQSKAGLANEAGDSEMSKDEHKKMLAELMMMKMKDRSNMAEGGEAMPMEDDDDLVHKVMMKRMSKGGMVANDTPVTADFEDNQFDDLVKDDELESGYTGSNAGDEIGDGQEDEDRRDIVSMIMKSRAKKDRMPRPA